MWPPAPGRRAWEASENPIGLNVAAKSTAASPSRPGRGSRVRRVRCLAALRGQAYSSHAQVLGAFNRDFVHAGTFPREFTVTLTRLFEDRQTGDYDPTTSLEQAEAERDVQDAERIVEAVASHLAT